MCDRVLNTPLVSKKYIIATEKLRWELYLLYEMLMDNITILRNMNHITNYRPSFTISQIMPFYALQGENQ